MPVVHGILFMAFGLSKPTRCESSPWPRIYKRTVEEDSMTVQTFPRFANSNFETHVDGGNDESISDRSVPDRPVSDTTKDDGNDSQTRRIAKEEANARDVAAANILLTLTELDANLPIKAWHDEISSELGFDPRSPYVERFWLGLLGPSATWLLRALAYGLEASPEGFALPPQDFARVLGLGDRTGKQSPLVRAVGRLCHFQLAYFEGAQLYVRTSLPWLDRRQVIRLPQFLQEEHQLWDAADEAENPGRAMRRRAALTAVGLARIGSSEDEIRRTLHQQRHHPAIASAVASWACAQQQIVRDATDVA